MEQIQIISKKTIMMEVSNGKSIGVNIMDEESGRCGSYSLQHSRHSQIRSKQRGINNTIITLAIEYGMLIQKQGYEFYVLGGRTLPGVIDQHIKDKAKNTVVMVQGGQIVTCYKGSHVIKHIQRKQKYLTAA